MLINIRPKYSGLVFAIQKDWKDKTINLAEVILQIIRQFEFIEGIKKYKSSLQTSQNFAPLSRSTPTALTGSYKHSKYIEKDLTTYYTNCYWIKYPELRRKYAFGHM